VAVGKATVTEGDRVNTGITAILPHPGSLYHERVPAAIYVGNGFGKLLGVTQVAELGELETPILLTCTLCVWKAADAMAEWALEQDGMENVGSLNAGGRPTTEVSTTSATARSPPPMYAGPWRPPLQDR